MAIIKLMLIFTLVLSSFLANSQTDEGKYEIGGSIGSVFFLNDDVNRPQLGLHFHGMRRVFSSRFAVGLGYEYVNDNHRHRTYSAVFQYEVFPSIKFILSPGVATEMHDGLESSFSYHAEINYEVELGKIHLGPALEYAYDQNDQHVSIGVHIGTSF